MLSLIRFGLPRIALRLSCFQKWVIRSQLDRRLPDMLPFVGLLLWLPFVCCHPALSASYKDRWHSIALVLIDRFLLSSTMTRRRGSRGGVLEILLIRSLNQLIGPWIPRFTVRVPYRRPLSLFERHQVKSGRCMKIRRVYRFLRWKTTRIWRALRSSRTCQPFRGNRRGGLGSRRE